MPETAQKGWVANETLHFQTQIGGGGISSVYSFVLGKEREEVNNQMYGMIYMAAWSSGSGLICPTLQGCCKDYCDNLYGSP